MLARERGEPAVDAGGYIGVGYGALGRGGDIRAGGKLVEGEDGITAAAFLAGGVAERIDGDVARYAAQKCAEAPRPFGRYGAPQAQKGVVDALVGVARVGEYAKRDSAAVCAVFVLRGGYSSLIARPE